MRFVPDRHTLGAVLLGCALAMCGDPKLSLSSEDSRGSKGDSGNILPDASIEDGGEIPGDSGAEGGCAEGGATCEQPIPLTAGVTVNSSTPSTGVTSAACLQSGAPQRFFSLTIPVRQRAVITVTPSASLQAVVRALERCDATGCIVGGAGSAAGAPVALRVDNFEDQPLNRIVTVSAGNAGTGGDFSILVRFEPVPNTTPPTNISCETALPVASGARLTGQDISRATMRRTSGCVGFGQSNQLFYSVTIPAGQTLTAVVTPVSETPWSPALSVFPSCTTSTCLVATRPVGRPGDPVPITYTNRTNTTQTVILSVAAGEPSPAGTFNLAVDVQPPAPNATCEGATPVSNGTMLSGVNLGLGGFGSAACAAQTGPALYYEATVPAGSAITARVRPMGPPLFVAVPQILGACGSACLASSTCGSGCLPPSTNDQRAVTYVNTTGASQTVHIRVELFAPDFPFAPISAIAGFFDLEVAIVPAATNTSCASARTVSNGDFLRNQSVLVSDVAPLALCGTNVTNPDLFYRAVVPPGATLSAVASPVTAFSPVVLLQTSCGGDNCIASSGGEIPGSSIAKYTNITGAPQEIFIVAGAAAFTTPGPYTLDLFFSIEPAPYTESSIPPACDDLSGAPEILPIGGAPRVLPLPFSFPFFGTNVTRYGALPEGLAQLFESDGVLIDARTVVNNQPIPWPDPPNGFVAPLWQPLAFRVTSNIHAALVECPSQHFTIEWTDQRAFPFEPVESQIFQAKLFKNTGVIEFHYCRLDPAGIGGQDATVGIESLSGTHGVQHSYRTAGAVSTSQAIRFTPLAPVDP